MENMREMLQKAKIGHYAVPHLNINNLEWTRYILEVAEEMQSPIILGVSVGAARYMGGFFTVANLVKGLEHDLKITVPVALHLDHGDTVEHCKDAIDAGFTSVMIDGSKYDLTENIKMVKEVVMYAHARNATVEAEVGAIGGEEDGIANVLSYAKTEDCVMLTQSVAIDALAPALGSVHGIYKGEPNLDFEKMDQIRFKTNLPLVLHGGTGIPDEKIRKAIACGICKINVNTELQIAWTKAVRAFLATDLNSYDPRKVIRSGEALMKDAIREKIILFGSNDKA